MRKLVDAKVERISKASGYSVGFLQARMVEIIEDNPDEDFPWDYFQRVSMEHDW